MERLSAPSLGVLNLRDSLVLGVDSGTPSAHVVVQHILKLVGIIEELLWKINRLTLRVSLGFTRFWVYKVGAYIGLVGVCNLESWKMRAEARPTVAGILFNTQGGSDKVLASLLVLAFNLLPGDLIGFGPSFLYADPEFELLVI